MGVYDWTDETIHSRPVYRGGNGSQYLYFAYNGAWMIDTNRHGIAGEVGAHDSSTCPTDVASDHWLAKKWDPLVGRERFQWNPLGDQIGIQLECDVCAASGTTNTAAITPQHLLTDVCLFERRKL